MELGLTDIEALACGTPVVTFRSGGSPETIDNTTGFTVEKGDITAAINCFAQIQQNGKAYYQQKCRKRAEQKFNKNIKFKNIDEIITRLVSDFKIESNTNTHIANNSTDSNRAR